MNRNELERMWRDPRNWYMWGFYNCHQDPRLWVPKRIKWCGWTINFGHPFGFKMFLILITLPLLLIMAIETGMI